MPQSAIGLGDARRGAISKAIDGWDRVRAITYGLRVVWVAVFSVLFGALLFLTPQAQDLFLEVRGSVTSGLRFWLSFYAAVLVIWVLPVYVAARWLLWHFREDADIHADARKVSAWVRQTVPALLAAACMAALVVGQLLALLNVPDLVDLTRIEDNIALHKQAMAALCGGPNIGCATAFGLLLGDGALWVVRTEWGLGTEWLIVLLYAFFLALGAWWLIGRWTLGLEAERRRLARAAWWLVTILALPAVLLVAMVFVGYLWAEAQNPHTIARLAFLPGLSGVIGYALWRWLRPVQGAAAAPARNSLAARAEAAAMQSVLDPLFWGLIAFSAVATVSLLLLDPVWVTGYVGRAQLVPFLLGPLVPPLTLLSYFSARLRAPLVIGVVLLVSAANAMVGDTNRVRTIPAGGAARPSLDAAVADWARANGCDIARPEGCPSPIVVAAAGGASRASFLVGELIGKLMDERTTVQALGEPAGGPRPLRPFETQLFAISAVSGGSVGAVLSYAVIADGRLAAAPGRGASPPCKAEPIAAFEDWYGSSQLEKPPRPPSESWQSCLGVLSAGDFLSPVFVRMIGGDLVGLGLTQDRAVTLETAWERRYSAVTGRNTLARGLAEVRAAAAAKGIWLPMLLLNGTSVQAGRRIVVSDVDTRLTPGASAGPGKGERALVDASDLHEMLEGLGAAPGVPVKGPGPDVALSTAATTSARFPLISPHGSIGGRDGVIVDRVVDGGYYENFGATTALELTRLLRTRYRLTPTVILVNNQPTVEKMDCVTDKTEVADATRAPQRVWFSLLTSPLDTVIRSRRGRGSHAAVELCKYVTSAEVGGAFAFITVRKSGDKPLSMSWWLSKDVQQYLALHLASGAAASSDQSSREQVFRRVNRTAFDEIVRQRQTTSGSGG